jgi:probable rRNA maturation factor
MKLRVEFVETSPLWRDALPARKLARQAISAAREEADVKLRGGAELTVHLIGDVEIRALNQQWRRKNEPTNVLSFPAAAAGALDQAPLLGDILIAFETVAREAEEEGKPLADHFRHLVVHGFLHLLGYDHILEEDAEEMESLERHTLARLGVPDPYAASELMDAFE